MGKTVDLNIDKIPAMSANVTGSMGITLENTTLEVDIGGVTGKPIVLNSNSALGGIPGQPIASQLGGIPNQPIALNLGLDISSLPTIRFAMEPTRVHFPLHYRFG